MKVLQIPRYDFVLEINEETGASTATSNFAEQFGNRGDKDSALLLEALLTAFAKSGINIEHPKYESTLVEFFATYTNPVRLEVVADAPASSDDEVLTLLKAIDLNASKKSIVEDIKAIIGKPADTEQ